MRQFADRRKQQKMDEKQVAKEKKKEEKRAMTEYLKVEKSSIIKINFPLYLYICI